MKPFLYGAACGLFIILSYVMVTADQYLLTAVNAFTALLCIHWAFDR